jgi:hypothetical protein
MRYHIINVSKREYLADYTGEQESTIWSVDPEEWREFGKKEARRIKNTLRDRGIHANLEKDLGV